MDPSTRLTVNAMRLYMFGIKLLRIDTAARAQGRDPGPGFDRLVRDGRLAYWDIRDLTNAANQRRESARARERFLARYPHG